MSNIDWSEALDLISDKRVLRYAGAEEASDFRDIYRMTITEYPLDRPKVSVEHQYGNRGEFRIRHLGYFGSISAARRAINRDIRRRAGEEEVE